MLLIRDTSIGNAVFGKLLIDGEKVCDTLENRETLIPLGEYNLTVCDSPKFGRELPLIHNDYVAVNRGIRIHSGNLAVQSSGCVLVGFGRGDGCIKHSKAAEAAVTALARTDKKLTIIGQPQEQYDDMDLFDMAQHQAAADARGCI